MLTEVVSDLGVVWRGQGLMRCCGGSDMVLSFSVTHLLCVALAPKASLFLSATSYCHAHLFVKDLNELMTFNRLGLFVLKLFSSIEILQFSKLFFSKRYRDMEGRVNNLFGAGT